METTENIITKPEAILKGKTFCSCGCGCTKADYDQALDKGKTLLKKMRGKGWKLYLSDSLGWHYEVKNGPISVWHATGTKKFYAVCSSGEVTMLSGAYSSPNKAAQEAFTRYENCITSELTTFVKAALAMGKTQKQIVEALMNKYEGALNGDSTTV